MAEAALAHTVRNLTEAAYARSDLFERRHRLMDDWAAYLTGPAGTCWRKLKSLDGEACGMST